MKGTEKIIAHIRADAEAQTAAILSQAEQQCAAIREDFEAKARDRYSEKLLAGLQPIGALLAEDTLLGGLGPGPKQLGGFRLGLLRKVRGDAGSCCVGLGQGGVCFRLGFSQDMGNDPFSAFHSCTSWDQSWIALSIRKEASRQRMA